MRNYKRKEERKDNCLECGVEFTTTQPKAKFCTDQHRKLYWRKNHVSRRDTIRKNEKVKSDNKTKRNKNIRRRSNDTSTTKTNIKTSKRKRANP